MPVRVGGIVSMRLAQASPTDGLVILDSIRFHSVSNKGLISPGHLGGEGKFWLW